MMPTWERDGVQLYLGDCRDVLPTLGKVDAVVTDPPYGTTALAFDKNPVPLSETIQIFIRDCGIYMGKDRFKGTYNTQMIGDLQRRKMTLRNSGGQHYKGNSLKNLEGVERKYEGRFPNSVLHFNNGSTAWATNDNEHPSRKPQELLDFLIGSYSNDGEVVADPFMGSGTTGVACVKLGRKFIGIEIEPKYFDIAVRRIDKELSQGKLFQPDPALVESQLELVQA